MSALKYTYKVQGSLLSNNASFKRRNNYIWCKYDYKKVRTMIWTIAYTLRRSTGNNKDNDRQSHLPLVPDTLQICTLDPVHDLNMLTTELRVSIMDYKVEAHGLIHKSTIYTAQGYQTGWSLSCWNSTVSCHKKSIQHQHQIRSSNSSTLLPLPVIWWLVMYWAGFI